MSLSVVQLVACSHEQPVIGWQNHSLPLIGWHSLLLILFSHQPRPAAAVHCTCSVATLFVGLTGTNLPSHFVPKFQSVRRKGHKGLFEALIGTCWTTVPRPLLPRPPPPTTMVTQELRNTPSLSPRSVALSTSGLQTIIFSVSTRYQFNFQLSKLFLWKGFF